MPRFTRVHYVTIAKEVKAWAVKAKAENNISQYVTAEFTFRLADLFQADNPNFNRKKFIEACSPNT